MPMGGSLFICLLARCLSVIFVGSGVRPLVVETGVASEVLPRGFGTALGSAGAPASRGSV